MTLILIFSLFVVCAYSAPYNFVNLHYKYNYNVKGTLNNLFDNNFFDLSGFFINSIIYTSNGSNIIKWNNNLYIEKTTEEYHNNEFRVTIPLIGFAKEDITVEIKRKILVVQALTKSKYDNIIIYRYTKSLPDNIDFSGEYSYKDSVLNISFPVLKKSKTLENSFNESPDFSAIEDISTTDSVSRSVEELESHDEGYEGNASVDNSKEDVDMELESY